MSTLYRQQAALMLEVLPDVAKEADFALHGGTAINYFFLNKPRLSVDIDLTYVPVQNRILSLENINQALLRVRNRIEAANPRLRVKHLAGTCKLQVTVGRVRIKIEVNMTKRGTLHPPEKRALCPAAQKQSGRSFSMSLVPAGQTYGGKICAALDRQHPRDLFDVKILLENEGITEEVKQGFLFNLVGGGGLLHASLDPGLKDQQPLFANFFEGMATGFTYAGYEQARTDLIRAVHRSLNGKDREFLSSVCHADPDWSIHDFERFPAVQWKLINLRKLKKANPQKHAQQCEALSAVLKFPVPALNPGKAWDFGIGD